LAIQTILDGIKIDSRANGELAFLSNPDFLAGSDFLRGHQSVEFAEKRKDAQLCREFSAGLPLK